jgi:hypothetical protein
MTYRPVPPPVAPPLPPLVPAPGVGEGLVGNSEGLEGEVVGPDRPGVYDAGLWRSSIPSLVHPPKMSISPRLITANGVCDARSRMCRQARVMGAPLSDMQKSGVRHGIPTILWDRCFRCYLRTTGDVDLLFEHLKACVQGIHRVVLLCGRDRDWGPRVAGEWHECSGEACWCQSPGSAGSVLI